MQNPEEIVETLHPLERKILPLLQKYTDVESLQRESQLKEVEIVRALQWLENKNILSIKTDTIATISLDENGEIYMKEGLPERRFLLTIKEPQLLKEIQQKAKLSNQELNIAIGTLKKRNLIEIKEKVFLTEQGKRSLTSDILEESFLKVLPLHPLRLTPEQKFAYQELSTRNKIIKTEIKKVRTITLTDLGKRIVNLKINQDYLEAVTPEIIKSQSWKKTKFRHYDIQSPVPHIYGGKKHPITQAIEYMKKIWMEMGFEEMDGPIVDSSFWIFDALFTAQDHPVREMQDTFFMKDINVELPEKKIIQQVKEAHEKGVLGSSGWKYEWHLEEAKKPVLRTHTTGLSVRTLSQLKHPDLPKKYFSIGKVFRNETLDWSHLFEFHQTEGIVVAENLNLKHLLGYLQEFFRKMGFEKVRFRPGFFSYVEPGVEVDVFHPIHKKWIELGGAGIFRPEVVYPLMGKDYPVLAWGLGLERIISLYYGLTDIRDLYKNDLKQLRELKTFLP